MLASESFSADEARRGVRTLQAHEREQLREAGKRKMNELRSLKAAVVQAHAAAKLLQQQNMGQAQSAGVLGSPRASCAAVSMQKQQEGHRVTTQPQQHAAAAPRGQAESASSQVPGPITSSSADSTKDDTPDLSTTAIGDNSSRAAGTGILQPSSSSAVAAAASAVAAGAAAVAANAAARAAAAAPSGSWADTPPAAATVVRLQALPSLQQQQQDEQNDKGHPRDVSTVDEVSVQDPMVDMLLLQVEALMSEKQQLAVKCCGLERENEQLAELVGHLHDTLETTVDQQEQQQQQQQGGPLLIIPSLDQQQLQQQTILEDDAEGVDEEGGSHVGCFDAAATAAAAGDVVYDPMSQSQSPTSTQEGLDVDGDQLMVTAHLTRHDTPTAPFHTATPAADTAPVPDTAPEGPAAETGALEAAAMMPFVAAAAPAAAAGPEEMFLANQKQMRVAEWLAHRVHEAVSSNSAAAGVVAAGDAQPPSLSCQRWQEQLPLEPMSSGSSSTLTITLAEA